MTLVPTESSGMALLTRGRSYSNLYVYAVLSNSQIKTWETLSRLIIQLGGLNCEG